MTNDVQEPNNEEAVSCFALSKNACYVISTSGGKISLFNMMTFKRVSCLHLQQQLILPSILKITTSSLLVKSKLKGHSKRIPGLAFSHLLNVLVSSGADSQSCVWSTVGRECRGPDPCSYGVDRYLNQIPECSSSGSNSFLCCA
ncbi:hypothetical protein EJD97_006927 [Solanum chilense]|uniref:Uncharacterized protein n=1 Tax=Solanum chilense TaxID=4083 RepID=A0A6N2ALT1_SOLCI|nr:hypothetical protein EJD97_006927 [Solanum chilense]